MTQDKPEERRLIVAGFGGQGVLTIGRLLCVAAMKEGKLVTYLPAYGGEVRGGTANCQVVISPGAIFSPVVEAADCLIILNQLSYERFSHRLRSDGLMLVNSSGVDLDEAPPPQDGARLVAVPAAEKAAQMGDLRAGNMIMLGAFVALSDLVRMESCRLALRQTFTGPKASLLDLNLEALQAGAQMGA